MTHRILQPGEMIQAGDEYLKDGEWITIDEAELAGSSAVAFLVDANSKTQFRRLEILSVDAEDDTAGTPVKNVDGESKTQIGPIDI